LLALTVAMAGATGNAHAAYAVSYDTITSFDVNFTGLSGPFNGFTFSTDVAANAGGAQANVGLMDAPPACVGTACVGYNNAFTSHGAAGDYAYGDAQIADANVMGGTGSASSIGEISAVTAFGTASGSNSMTAFFTLGAGGGTASFSFNAAPYLSIAAGSTATASSSMSITILNQANSQQVFSWTPNGNIGTGIVGGSEAFDAFNLNTGTTPGLTYNPGTGFYQATTNSLAAGTYSVSINMGNQVTAVPEADTYAMLLAGLGLVGFAARRKLNHG